MYICVCNAVTESQIHALVANGVNTLEGVQQITGCAATCGNCQDMAEHTIRKARRRNALVFELPLLSRQGEPA